MRKRLLRAALVSLLLLAAMAVLHALGLGLPLLLGAAIVAFVLSYFMPRLGVRALDRVGMLLRAWMWREEEGRHVEFGGVSLHVQDDGRHLWLAAEDLQRVLRRREPEDALAARHSERWRRDGDGRLWLRLDAVVSRLATMPGRDEPRVQKLRRYFERDVLFPHAQRARRGRPD